MPKELHEIKNFQHGIISSPSTTDVPENAAVFSKNIDPTSAEGTLDAIKEDKQKIEGISSSSSTIIDDELVYFDYNSKQLKRVSDISSKEDASPDGFIFESNDSVFNEDASFTSILPNPINPGSPDSITASGGNIAFVNSTGFDINNNYISFTVDSATASKKYIEFYNAQEQWTAGEKLKINFKYKVDGYAYLYWGKYIILESGEDSTIGDTISVTSGGWRSKTIEATVPAATNSNYYLRIYFSSTESIQDNADTIGSSYGMRIKDIKIEKSDIIESEVITTEATKASFAKRGGAAYIGFDSLTPPRYVDNDFLGEFSELSYPGLSAIGDINNLDILLVSENATVNNALVPKKYIGWRRSNPSDLTLFTIDYDTDSVTAANTSVVALNNITSVSISHDKSKLFLWTNVANYSESLGNFYYIDTADVDGTPVTASDITAVTTSYFQGGDTTANDDSTQASEAHNPDNNLEELSPWVSDIIETHDGTDYRLWVMISYESNEISFGSSNDKNPAFLWMSDSYNTSGAPTSLVFKDRSIPLDGMFQCNLITSIRDVATESGSWTEFIQSDTFKGTEYITSGAAVEATAFTDTANDYIHSPAKFKISQKDCKLSICPGSLYPMDVNSDFHNVGCVIEMQGDARYTMSIIDRITPSSVVDGFDSNNKTAYLGGSSSADIGRYLYATGAGHTTDGSYLIGKNWDPDNISSASYFGSTAGSKLPFNPVYDISDSHYFTTKSSGVRREKQRALFRIDSNTFYTGMRTSDYGKVQTGDLDKIILMDDSNVNSPVRIKTYSISDTSSERNHQIYFDFTEWNWTLDSTNYGKAKIPSILDSEFLNSSSVTDANNYSNEYRIPKIRTEASSADFVLVDSNGTAVDIGTGVWNKHAGGANDYSSNRCFYQEDNGGGQRYSFSLSSSATSTLVDFGNSGSDFTGSTIDSNDTTNNSATFKLSFIYDGYQESPLTTFDFPITGGTASNNNQNYNTDGATTLQILLNLDMVPKRATHLCVYKKDGAVYRFLSQYSLAIAPVIIDSDKDKYLIEITDEGGTTSLGATYEARTGIPQTLKRSIVNYTESVELNGELYVIGAYIPETKEPAENYIFKSKPGNFSQFNWVHDNLLLPEKPVAIIGFRGKLYAFTTSSIITINANGFYIEDIFDGIGTISQDCVISSEYGLFFVNENGAYLHDGIQPIKVSKDIETFNLNDWEIGFKDFIKNSLEAIEGNSIFRIKTAYEPKTHSFIVCGYNKDYINGSDVYTGVVWAYNIDKRRWDYWDSPNHTDIITSSTNSLYIVDAANNLKEYLGATTKRLWDWFSKFTTIGTDTQEKIFSRIKIFDGMNQEISETASESDTLTVYGNTNALINMVKIKDSYRLKSSTTTYTPLLCSNNSGTFTTPTSIHIMYGGYTALNGNPFNLDISSSVFPKRVDAFNASSSPVSLGTTDNPNVWLLDKQNNWVKFEVNEVTIEANEFTALTGTEVTLSIPETGSVWSGLDVLPGLMAHVDAVTDAGTGSYNNPMYNSEPLCNIDSSPLSKQTLSSKKAKKIQVRLRNQTAPVDSIGVIFRRKSVK